MMHLSYSFDTVRKMAKKAGISGLWQRQLNRRWRLAVTEHAGLEWSPTRAKLLFYGPSDLQGEWKAAIEKALKSELIVAHDDKSDELEEILTISDLVGWLIQYMQAGEKCDYLTPVVDCAEYLVREFSDLDDDYDMPAFLMWSPPPCLGSNFVQLTRTCPTRPYSSMLMDWAGRMYHELSLAELPPEDALKHTIKAAGLENLFRQKEKGSKIWLMSRRKFEERFRLRVRVELASSIW
ncbi:hypothetical protein [Microvirga aerophila]|uniref:Uncharacterized protein n=2 Tax=Microvirga aerophila TaxID=670291 RepID=A0A512C572_9HYPH|nr:hypothetical protein [Microvirga aerophila]GEO19359.1 hypothetical protein MAE02_70550 [Microvirga aerophila]